MEKKIDFEKEIERIGKVRKMITDKHIEDKKKHRDVSGEIECPYCKDGYIRYGIAYSYNGHVWASCSNKCVEWME